MEQLRCSTRVVKMNQNIVESATSTSPPLPQQPQPRKFNPTPAPITRPPSSCENRLTKIQKIKPANNSRKRHKWNDRFHIQSEEEKQQFQPPPPSFTQIIKKNPSQPRNKPKKKQYATIHAPILEKKKPKSSIIPPIDPITGRRQWGKRNRKRAKWSIIKHHDTNDYNNSHVNRNRPRSKWNKPQEQPPQQHADENIINSLSLSRSRVLPLTPKSGLKPESKSLSQIEKKEERQDNEEDSNVKLNDGQRQEFAKLFSTVLKSIISNEDKSNLQHKDVDKLRKYISDKSDTEKIEKNKCNEQKEENEILDDGDNDEMIWMNNKENEENVDSLNLAQTLNEIPKVNYRKRASRKLLPINNRNKLMNQQRRQYLEPLDKVADIILDDLIEQVGQELDTFCCHVVDTLIDSEINI